MDVFLVFLAEWLGVLGVVWLAGISPRFKAPVLGFKYPRREGFVSLGIFGICMIFAFIQAGGWMRPLLVSDNPAFQPALTRLNLALITLVPFIVSLLIRRQPLYSGLGSGFMVGANLRLGLALAFGTMFLRGKFTLVLDGVSGTEGVILLVCAAICAVEEFIFRGFIQLRMRSWLGEWRGWIATALMFIAWQIPFWWASGDRLWINLLFTIGQAIVLGLTAQRSKHILAPVIYRTMSEWLFFVS